MNVLIIPNESRLVKKMTNIARHLLLILFITAWSTHFSSPFLRAQEYSKPIKEISISKFNQEETDWLERHKKGKRNRPWYRLVKPDPKLPFVLLIGDSISMRYTAPVQNNLKGVANVYRIPANFGDSTNGLKHLDEWLWDKKWSVIHFNSGLHDLKRIANIKDGEKITKGPSVNNLYIFG